MGDVFSWHKFIYLITNILAWLLAGMLVHWFLEMPILYFLSLDFGRYSFGFSYNQLLALHTVFSLLIILTSVSGGIYFGLKWYKKIYQHPRKVKRRLFSRSAVKK